MVETKRGSMPYIGDRLRELRRKKLLTQEELAQKAGITPTALARAEQNHTQPRFRTIRKLAEALDVDPTELTGE
jgi:transcriptional regulator with XRE-family HTH domain